MNAILMLSSTLPRHSGDLQANFVGEQACAWRRERPEDQITILAPHHAGASRRELCDGIETVRFRYLVPESWQVLAYPAILPNLRRNPLLAWQIVPFLIGQYRAALHIVRRDSLRLIYAHWVMPQGLVAWLVWKQTGTPYVLQNHSSDLAVFERLGGPGRSLARQIIRDARHFFCVNANQQRAALELFAPVERESIAHKMTVLPMGIEQSEVIGSRTGPHVWDIGSIGRLSRKKGLDHLIEAAELLAQRGLRPRIALAGDGEDRARLQSLVRHADIHFPGFLTGEAKTRFMTECARFAFPACATDGDVEGMPVALLEALSIGAPVLASRDTNIELLPEWTSICGEVQFVPDPADTAALARALERLLEVAPATGGPVAQAIGRYRWDRLIGEYLAVMDGALAVGVSAQPE